MLRFGDACHAHGVARIKTEVLEGAVLFAEDEVVGGRQLEFFELDAGCSEPNPDKFIGFGIWQGLEEDAFEDAENNGVGPYASGQRDKGDDREQRGTTEPAEDLLELVFKGLHGLPPRIPAH